MKKLLLSLSLLIFCAFSYAQTTFDQQIKQKSEELTKATTADQCGTLFNEFSNIVTTKDPNQWKAYYFAGFSLYKKVEILLKEAKNGGLADTNALSYKYAMGAFVAQPKNSDVLKLISLIEKQKKSFNK